MSDNSKLNKRISIEYKKEDLWIGVFWNKYTIYLCLIPCFPISIKRSLKCYTCGQYQTECRLCSCTTENHDERNTCSDCGECIDKTLEKNNLGVKK